MAKAKTAGAPKAKKKTAKAAKAIAKAGPAKSGKKPGKKAGKKSSTNAADALWKLADHPLVGELIAIGATAAVAAIAQQGLGKSRDKKQGSTRAVKEAGKAAAAAIGARLISEFAEAKDAKKAKPAKA